jgi:hypothetical protein
VKLACSRRARIPARPTHLSYLNGAQRPAGWLLVAASWVLLVVKRTGANAADGCRGAGVADLIDLIDLIDLMD